METGFGPGLFLSSLIGQWEEKRILPQRCSENSLIDLPSPTCLFLPSALEEVEDAHWEGAGRKGRTL